MRLAQVLASSLCLGSSLSLCPMSAKQPSVPSVLGPPCRCAPCQPSSLQFPLFWALLVAVPMSAKQPSVPSVLGSPCRCAPCQPSSLQFPLSWALLVAVPHVSQFPLATFSSSSTVRLHVEFGLSLCSNLLESKSTMFSLVGHCSF